VRATATAQVFLGNASDCLVPFGLPDKWDEFRAPADEFNRYVDHGGLRGELLATPDEYRPPDGPDPTGYRLSEDYGVRVTLKLGRPRDTIARGWYLPLDLPRPGGPATGGDRYSENIASCNNQVVPISTPESPSMLVNEPGGMIGPTRAGVEALVARDPGAHWVGQGSRGRSGALPTPRAPNRRGTDLRCRSLPSAGPDQRPGQYQGGQHPGLLRRRT